ncbi:MAG: hypothetical protein Q7S34_01375 [bacterium]|nr:hypothetical protein [bacterium]
MEELSNVPDKNFKPSNFEKFMDQADAEGDLLSKSYESMTDEEKKLADDLAKVRRENQTGETLQ